MHDFRRLTTFSWTLGICALFLTLFVGLTDAAIAQTVTVPDPTQESGYKPFGSFAFGDFDSVNVMNLELDLHIPLVSYPQRGGKLKVGFELAYQPNLITFLPIRPSNENPSGDGYHPASEPASLYVRPLSGAWIPYPSDNFSYDSPSVTVVSPLDGSHNLSQSTLTSTPGLTNYTYYATDSSGWMAHSNDTRCPASASISAVSRNGIINCGSANSMLSPSYAPVYMRDTNGNSITYTGYGSTLGSGPGIITDSVGRSIPIPPFNANSLVTYNPANQSSPSPSWTSDNSSCSGTNATASAFVWGVPGYDGQTANYKFCFTLDSGIELLACTDSSNFATGNAASTVGCPNGPAAQPARPGSAIAGSSQGENLQSLVLPNDTSWAFEYDPVYGDLTSITTPLGGTVTYTWANFTVQQGLCNEYQQYLQFSRGVASRTVDANDGTGPHTWTYTQMVLTPELLYSTVAGVSYAVKVTNPDQSYVVHYFSNLNSDFSNCAYFETSTKTYSSTGTLLQTQNRTYSSIQISDGTTAAGTPASMAWSPVLTNSTTTLGNGEQSSVVMGYDSGVSVVGIGSAFGPPVNVLMGSVTSKKTYDYGSGAPGSLMSAIDTAYLWQNNASYLNAGLLNLVGNTCTASLGKTACTGSSTDSASYATFGYDETGSPQGAIGNQTSVHAWLNTTGTSLTTTAKYNSNGMPTTTTDANGNSTTLTYDSTGEFVSKTQQPTTGGVAHVDYSSFDPTTGLLTSSTDQNGTAAGDPSHTTVYTYDIMNRSLGATLPDGGSETIKYIDSTPPSILATTATGETSGPIKRTFLYDGEGRVQEVQTTSDSYGVVNVYTAYDSLGRILSTSNPYRSKSESTYGTTSYTYDALNRKLSQLNPDNSSLKWQFTGNVVTETDEAGNQHQQTSDGLGRVSKVLEPNGVSKTASMETDYQYDALNNLQSVSQTGGGTTAVARTLTYDSLSRLICASNPETSSASCPAAATSSYTVGTTGYTYDNDGNPLSKSSPAVNVSSGTATQVIGYCYDQLNRIVGKWSAAPPTGCNSTPTSVTSSLLATYEYDTSTYSGATNVKGQLSEEKAYVLGVLAAVRDPYQYDSMGRSTIDRQEPYAPNSLGYRFLYGYDLAGNLTCANNGLASVVSSSTCANYTPITSSITASYSYDSAGRLSNVMAGTPCTSGICTPFALTTLYSATNYGPSGILNANYGDGLDLTRVYDSRGRVVDHEVYSSSDAFGWATVTISGAEQTGDSGTVSVTAGGIKMSTPYGATSTAASIATALAEAINATDKSPVTAVINPVGSATIRLTAFQPGSGGDVALSAISTDSGSSSSSFATSTSGTVLSGGGSGTESDAYYYRLTYGPNGNISNAIDMYNSTVSYGYDTLNRLISATGNQATYPYQCWSYDGFGNRYFELDMTSANHVACPAANASAGSGFTAPLNAQYLWATYNSSNQVTGTAVNGAAGGFNYDLAGNVTYDGANRYVYDPEGRICAVLSAGPTYTQYVYDAEGRRTAKGSISGANVTAAFPVAGAGVTPYCAAPTGSGFNLAGMYLRDFGDNQNTELTSLGAWVHTNIFSGSELTATYWNNASTPTLSYDFGDWLGTKRMQATSASPTTLEEFSQSQPYGNYLAVTGNGGDATEHHFTGKERDTESGNDFFGARYYASSLGRFMSPDPAGPWAADVTDPQSWNFYEYSRNNPLINVDPDGFDCVYLNDAGTDVDRDANGNVSGIDTNSDSGECSKSHGYWVDGTFTSGTVYTTNNDVNLNGYLPGTSPGTGTLTSASYTSTTAPASPDLDSTPNIFAFSPSQPLPKSVLTEMISSLNFSGQSNKLIDCIVSTESSGKPGAGNSTSTAKGLMQVLKGGAKDVAQHGKGGTFEGMNGKQLYAHATDPAANIATGTALLKLKVGYAGGNLQNGLDMYGTGAPYGQNRLACANGH
jgi:RHS repeat-associated protein